jgi:hypothetical protein
MTEATDMAVFTTIAEENRWGATESVSGPGSTLRATEILRSRLADAFARLRVRSIVDAPCGDMNWMRTLPYPFETYVGVDVVPAIIAGLRQRREFQPGRPGLGGTPRSTRYNFQLGDLTTDILPSADVLLCRDCLVHLPFAAIDQAVERIRLAGFRYLFATTFTDVLVNGDIAAGDWRPLNMQKAPFDWPEPLMVLPEGLAPPHASKSIGVWAL